VSRVLLTDRIAADAVRVLESFGGIEAVSIDTPSPAELLDMIGEYDAIVVRSPTHVTGDVIERGTKLRFIGRAGVGVDNIDVAAATRRGIVVINSPRSNTISTAEHTLAVMLAVAREIPRAHATVTSGKWDRDSFKGVELNGKVLGIVGLGRVGSEVAARARAFGMTVLATDPFVAPSDAGAGIRMVALHELLPQADWITVHAPLLPETRGLIGVREIAAMKKGVFVINCARGGIVDEKALADALDSGHVAAAGLDVFEAEPPGTNRLLSHPRSVFTPHLGAATTDAQRRVATDVAESIGLALARGEIRDAVNTPR